MTLEGLALRVRNGYIRVTANRRRKKINTDSFTVISNNCWSGLVYESYNLEKQSPTVGLFFMAEEYIRFLSNLKHYLCECELTFVEPEESRHKDFYQKDRRFGTYPIAHLGDVEIAMLHYHSQQEAREKWQRRCQRVNWEKLIVKMNDQNDCTEEHIAAFDALDFQNKLLFTVRPCQVRSCKVYRPRDLGQGFINGLQEPFGGRRRCNINDYINGL